MNTIQNRAFLIADNSAISAEDRVMQLSDYFGSKGYGDREQEIQFLSMFFMTIFEKYPQLTSIEWRQYQDWADQGIFFDLTGFLFNEDYEFNFFQGFNNAPDYTTFNKRLEVDYEFRSRLKDKQDDIEFHRFFNSDGSITNEREMREWMDSTSRIDIFEKVKTETAWLKKPVQTILVFLKALYEHYRPYYFIYVFGRRAKVYTTIYGIKIDSSVDNLLMDGPYWDAQLNV